MRGFIKKRLGRHIKDQQGFTLIEMLVVIGIIVALAAVIVPLVIQFSGEGAAASADAEWDNVQTTIDIMMSDLEVTTLTTVALAEIDRTVIADTLELAGAGTSLGAYTRDPYTNNCYTWDTTGRLLGQYEWTGTAFSTPPLASELEDCDTVLLNP